jgi:hypothetical protein
VISPCCFLLIGLSLWISSQSNNGAGLNPFQAPQRPVAPSIPLFSLPKAEIAPQRDHPREDFFARFSQMTAAIERNPMRSAATIEFAALPAAYLRIELRQMSN